MEKQIDTNSPGNGILIVENELILAEDLALTLSDFGYDMLDRASTGEEAIAKVRHGNVGFVLMDIKLDGQMDGIEAAERIKRISNIPIVYLTAFSHNAYLKRAKRTMPYGYLLKPYRNRELKAVVEMVLHKAAMERCLEKKIKFLEEVIKRTTDANDILTICCHCKKIKTKDGLWEFVESYIESHTMRRCSHSICPICAHELYPEYDLHR